jgi:hypothetical protein
MKRMVEAQGVFRESGLSGPDALRGAEIAAPLLSKIAFANAALHPDKAGQMDTNALAMMRFVEMRGGVNDPKQFNTIANLGYKAIQTSGGNVSWDLYRQFMATGGVAAQGMNNKALFGEMEPIIGELKSRAGTAYMTAFNRLTGITRVPNQVAHELVNQGLWDGSKIEWNSQGGIKTMRGNPLKDMGTFSASQIEWYVKNVIPMYDRMKLSDPDRNREDALLGGRTGGMMFSIIRRQLGPIGLSVAAQAKAMDIDQAGGAAANTPWQADHPAQALERSPGIDWRNDPATGGPRTKHARPSPEGIFNLGSTPSRVLCCGCQKLCGSRRHPHRWRRYHRLGGYRPGFPPHRWRFERWQAPRLRPRRRCCRRSRHRR